jgi:hypothetical protein
MRHTYKEHVIHLTTTRFGVYWEVWDGEERRGYGYTCSEDPLEHPRRFVDRIATDDASAPALADPIRVALGVSRWGERTPKTSQIWRIV